MSDITEYIKNKLIEAEPDADIRPGSALYDLMIAPLSSIMGPYVDSHNALIDFLTLRDPDSISEDEMDHLASNFFVTRLEGSKVTGNVRVYFDRPVNLEIPKNTIFRAQNGAEFIAKYSYSVTRADMAANLEATQYHSGDILVEALDYGTEYEIPANTLSEVLDISVVPSRVRNPRAFVATGSRETNAQLAERIRNTFINTSLSSTSSIKSSIQSNYPNIRDIQVIGAGSPYMKRDIVSVGPEYISNYFGKRKGFILYPDNPSIAYYITHNAYSLTTESGVNLPALSDFTKEFDFYQNIWRDDGNWYETQDEKEIETETFNGQYWAYSGLGSNNYVNSDWRLRDAKYDVDGYNPFAFSLIPSENAIRLGISQEDIPANTTVSSSLASQILELLSKVRDGYNDLYDVSYITTLIGQIEESQNPEVIFDYSPTFFRTLSTNVGIAITGKMKTTASGVDASMSYITVNRDNSVIAPHDGYGIAWKPGDGNTYNVYVVDNNVLQDDIWIGQNMIVQDYGINNFLQAYKLEILPNTWYNFRMEIGSDYSVKFWKNTDTIDITTTADIVFGPVQFGGAKPLSADSGTDFGISVANTKNQEWYYGEIGIVAIEDNFPLHMFQVYLDPSYFKADDILTINYYGVGEGINASGAVITNSLLLYAYNHSTEDWDEIAGHDNAAGADIQAYTVSGIAPTVTHGTDYVDNNYLTLLAATDTRTQPQHKIKTYYLEVVNGDGTHIGNYADIYIDSPERIQTASYAATVNNGVVSFTGAGPVQEITSVEIDGGPTLEDTQWSVSYTNEGQAYSSGGIVRIIPTEYNEDGTNVTINYRYLADGAPMQAFVESDNFRFPSQNNLIKVMPAYTLQIDNFIYTGNVTESELKEALRVYINSLKTKTVSISDLVSIAIENGASSVDTSDIDITVRYGKLNGRRYTTPLVNSYTIEGMGYFFVRTEDLSGVSQL